MKDVIVPKAKLCSISNNNNNLKNHPIYLLSVSCKQYLYPIPLFSSVFETFNSEANCSYSSNCLWLLVCVELDLKYNLFVSCLRKYTNENHFGINGGK